MRPEYKNTNDFNGKRTRDLPAFSSVPQPTAPTRTSHRLQGRKVFYLEERGSKLFEISVPFHNIEGRHTPDNDLKTDS
jgi:hypothetical protein